MSFGIPKVLSAAALMPIIATALLLCSAHCVTADTSTQDSYQQILQSAKPYLSPAKSQLSTAQLQSLLDISEKYFSTKRQQERDLFDRQNLSDKNVVLGQSFPLQTPPARNIVLDIFQKYFSKANITAASPAELIQLRNLLRRLKVLEQGHLSGMVWLYNSPLPGFASEQQLWKARLLVISGMKVLARSKAQAGFSIQIAPEEIILELFRHRFPILTTFPWELC